MVKKEPRAIRNAARFYWAFAEPPSAATATLFKTTPRFPLRNQGRFGCCGCFACWARRGREFANAIKRLHAVNRAHAVAVALRRGLIDLIARRALNQNAIALLRAHGEPRLDGVRLTK
jgi:hypothetical protein